MKFEKKPCKTKFFLKNKKTFCFQNVNFNKCLNGTELITILQNGTESISSIRFYLILSCKVAITTEFLSQCNDMTLTAELSVFYTRCHSICHSIFEVNSFCYNSNLLLFKSLLFFYY